MERLYSTQSGGVNATEITRPFNPPRWAVARPKPIQSAKAARPLVVESPALLQLKVITYLALGQWEAYAGPASAQKYLHHFHGQLPRAVCRRGEAQARLHALNESSQKALARFKGAQIVTITFNGEHAAAAIARLELNGGRVLPPEAVSAQRQRNYKAVAV